MQPEIVAARDSTTVPVKKPFGKAGDFASVSFLLLHELPHGVAHGFAAAGINATFYQRIQSVNLPFRQTYLNTVHNTPRSLRSQVVSQYPALRASYPILSILPSLRECVSHIISLLFSSSFFSTRNPTYFFLLFLVLFRNNKYPKRI